MNKLVARTELAKIAALLSVPSADLQYLATLDAEALRTFRRQAADMLDETDRLRLAKAARVGSRIPARLAARLAVRFVPARVGARTAEIVTTRKAIKVGKRLPAPYLAEVLRNSSLRRIKDLLDEVPEDVVINVAKCLSDQRDFATMGRLVAYLKSVVLQAAISELSDETILLTAYYFEDEDTLDRLFSLIPESRLDGMLAAVREHDLWTELVSLLALLKREQHARLVERTIHQDDEFRAAFLKPIDANDAWDTMLAMYRVLPPEEQIFFAGLVARRPIEVLERYVYAAIKGSLWGDLSGLILAMPDEARTKMVGMCRRIGDETGSLGLQELARQLSEVTTNLGAQDASPAAS